MINQKLNNAISAIGESAKRGSFRLMLKPILLTPEIFSKQWLQEHHWVAVPAMYPPSSDPFFARLTDQSLATGITECVAIRIHDADMAAEEMIDSTDFEECYSVPMSLEALKAFERERLSLCYALFPLSRSWVIAFSEEIFIIAGSKDFVVRVLGASIQDAVEAFLVQSSPLKSLNDHTRKFFERIEQYYVNQSV